MSRRPPTGPGAASLAFVNGKIVTLNAASDVARAVAVRGPHVSAVGSDEEIRRHVRPETRVVDLAGRAVIPGLIDGHAHVDRQGLKQALPSLAGARSIEEILERISALAARAVPGEWIVTMPVGDPPDFEGVPGCLKEGRFPNRWDLDRVAPRNPVYIRSIWGYWRTSLPLVSIANSEALRLAGVDRATEPPVPSIQIERDVATGEPTGVFLESNKMPVVEFTLMANAPSFDVATRTAALAPALFYYLSLFIQADLEAARTGLHGVPAAELPRARDVLRRGWVFLLPIVLLIYMLLVENYPVDVTGIAAAALTLVVPLLNGTAGHFRPARLLGMLERTGRSMLDIGVVCALAGVVMGLLNLSGILFKMTLILSSLSFGHPIVLLGVVALICIVLGMGLPSIVIYVLLSVMIAPTLVSLGIAPIAAHLFIFYFGMLSMITPPICLAVFAASSIAGSRIWPTGWAGMRLGIVAYIVPFIFAFQPALLMQGPWYDIVLADLTAVIGVVCLSIGCAGFLFQRVGVAERVLYILAGVALIPPPTTWLLIGLNFAGALVAGALVLHQWVGRSRDQARLGAAPVQSA